jgi:protein SCO1/2
MRVNRIAPYQTKFMKRCVLLLAVCLSAAVGEAEQKYAVTGMLLRVDPSRQTMVVSCKEIPGYMGAMAMSFAVHEHGTLGELKPGDAVGFTLVVKKNSSYAENVHTLPFDSLELDPTELRRLKLLEQLVTPGSSALDAVAIGQAIPDFTLMDQNRQRITLSQFAGKVVGVTFIYTRCPRPEYCFRLSNNFGRLRKRFKDRMGRDLVLLSIVIDPGHDQPEALAKYARIWKADAASWHFLTGPLPDVQQVCRQFDMSFYPDEALLLHSFRTAIIDRHGRMAAILDGNDFTFEQLADLVQTVMDRQN